MVDLPDDKTVPAPNLHPLPESEGNDLKNVNMPLFSQIGFLIFIFIMVMVALFTLRRFFQRWKKAPNNFTPYKVIKQASNGTSKKKGVCAVVGGTGFVGHHIVDELVSRGEYYVVVLGRKFLPKRTNPDVDCLIQVDMMDLDGLTNALQGVDCVLNTATFSPNVFLQADEVYSKSRTLHGNLLKAIKKAKVKNLVHISALYPHTNFKEVVFQAYINSYYEYEKDVTAANGVDDLNTCVVELCNILGLNSTYIDPLVSGKTTSFPMSDKMPTSFMPVEYLATILVNAMEKLANPATRKEVAGKVFPLRGEPMTWKDLLSLPGWPKKISAVNPFVFHVMTKINVMCAKWLQWAPFGPTLTPVVRGILDSVEEEMSEEKVQKVYDTLGVGPPNPPMAEYIGMLVSRYNAEKTEEKKKQ